MTTALRHDLADQHARRVYNRATVAYRSADRSAAAPHRVADPARRARAGPRPVRRRPRSRSSGATRSDPSRRAGRVFRRTATRVSADVAARPADTEKQLAWERRHRPRAGDRGAARRPRPARLLRRSPARCCATCPRRAGWSRSCAPRSPARRRAAVAADPVLRVPRHEAAPLLLIGRRRPVRLRRAGLGGGFLGVATRARATEFRRFLIYLPIVGGVVRRHRRADGQIGTRRHWRTTSSTARARSRPRAEPATARCGRTRCSCSAR